MIVHLSHQAFQKIYHQRNFWWFFNFFWWENFGGKIINASEVWHGKVDTISHLSNCPMFNSINFEFKATRYHSLVSSKNIPDCLEVTAISKNDHEIMAVKHIKHKIFGLQFHPESIETIDGKKMIENFINVI